MNFCTSVGRYPNIACAICRICIKLPSLYSKSLIDWEVVESFDFGGVALEGTYNDEIYVAYGEMDWDKDSGYFVWVETKTIEEITKWKV